MESGKRRTPRRIVEPHIKHGGQNEKRDNMHVISLGLRSFGLSPMDYYRDGALAAAAIARRRAGDLLDPETGVERAGRGDSKSNNLLDLGVEPMEAHRWRLLASIPKDTWDDVRA